MNAVLIAQAESVVRSSLESCSELARMFIKSSSSGLCTPFEAAHPPVVAGGADILYDKTPQIVAAKKFVLSSIFAMTVLLER